MAQLAVIDIGNEFNLGSQVINDPASAYNTTMGGGVFVILSVILKNLYVIAAIILFFFIFAGGLGMVINAGNAEKQKQSSQTLSSAVIGFLILFSSYWLIKLIELVLGIQILKLF